MNIPLTAGPFFWEFSFRVPDSGNRNPIPGTRFPDSDLRRRLFFLTLFRYRTIASHISPLPYDNYSLAHT